MTLRFIRKLEMNIKKERILERRDEEVEDGKIFFLFNFFFLMLNRKQSIKSERRKKIIFARHWTWYND